MTYTREIATLARAERQAKSDLQAADYSADPAARRNAEGALRAARDALLGVVRANLPTESITCLALVRPGSGLAREWQLPKPAYCIYAYDRMFGTREIRWGDGSHQAIDAEDHLDLVLLPQFGSAEIDDLFEP